MKKSTILLFIILISFSAKSQEWTRFKYELYYGLGATNFMGDVSARKDPDKMVWVDLWNTIGVTANVGLRYQLNERNLVRGDFYLGQLYGNEPAEDEKTWQRGLKFNSLFTEVAAKYEFVIWKEKRKTTVYRQIGESPLKNFSVPTYLFVGMGATFNVGKFKQVSTDGRYLLEETFANIAPVVPFGIGFKYKINKLTYINLEATWHFTMSDGLDNADTKKNTHQMIFGSWYDQYQTITFNLVYKVRQNPNGTPKLTRK